MPQRTNYNRKHSGRSARPDHYAIHKQEADERLAAWTALSPKEQLQSLDRRLGKGVGAVKQRARIAAVQPAK